MSAQCLIKKASRSDLANNSLLDLDSFLNLSSAFRQTDFVYFLLLERSVHGVRDLVYFAPFFILCAISLFSTSVDMPV